MNAILQPGFSIVARSTDPHTSHARRNMSLSEARRVAILAAVKLHGPMNVSEIAGWIGIPEDEVNRRCSDLRTAGRLKRIETGTFNGKPIYRTRLSSKGEASCLLMLP